MLLRNYSGVMNKFFDQVLTRDFLGNLSRTKSQLPQKARFERKKQQANERTAALMLYYAWIIKVLCAFSKTTYKKGRIIHLSECKNWTTATQIS